MHISMMLQLNTELIHIAGVIWCDQRESRGTRETRQANDTPADIGPYSAPALAIPLLPDS